MDKWFNLRKIFDFDIFKIFLIFLLSRFAIFAITIFVKQILPFYVETGEMAGQVDFLKIPFENTLTNFGSSDISWYRGIAETGYDKIPYEETKQHNWAFFPLWPMVWWLIIRLFPNQPLMSILVCNIFFLGGIINIYRLCQQMELSQRASFNTIILICLHPMSYFFAFPFTESIYLFLSSAFCYSFLKGNFIQSGGWGFLSSLTRPNGILLIIFPIFEGISEYIHDTLLDKRKFFSLIVCVLMTLFGLFAFMGYLQYITGNVFAFSDIQVTWHRKKVFFLITLWEYLRNINLLVSGWDFRISNLISFFLCVISVSYLWWRSPTLPVKKFSRAIVIYAFLSLLLPTNTGTLASLTRYLLTSFPMFIAISLFLEKRPTLFLAILITFSLLLGMMLVLYASGYVLAAS